MLYHHGGPDDTINHWTLIDDADENHHCVEGALIHKGYRSAGLLILVIRATDDRAIHRVPVWRDSVSPLEFSYLNLQLLFNTRRS